MPIKDAAAVLIQPFDKIWRDLEWQARAWITIRRLVAESLDAPVRLRSVLSSEQLKSPEVSALLSDMTSLSDDARSLLTSQHQAIVYPGLVGAWAVTEAAFDDLLVSLIVNDTDTAARLAVAGIKMASVHPPQTAEWAREIYGRLESQAKSGAKKSVVETHRLCLAVVGVKFDYPPDRAQIIEEMNQARNCILHTQGKVDKKAASICPRFSKYLGSFIPTDDPVFAVGLTMLSDYTLAWVAAFIHSHFLNAALLPEAKNPFST